MFNVGLMSDFSQTLHHPAVYHDNVYVSTKQFDEVK